ncbi:hypothetical protein LENED_004508 [Lentinula edodes]|uniref:Uncharacterized protein n=1 Tax=Lentinula edodes TaxID=5353 RepID=A0A1Q3E6H2_LENED|nr:hypothetical protein LENED_004508 [Lentinula edodes]
MFQRKENPRTGLVYVRPNILNGLVEINHSSLQIFIQAFLIYCADLECMCRAMVSHLSRNKTRLSTLSQVHSFVFNQACSNSNTPNPVKPKVLDTPTFLVPAAARSEIMIIQDSPAVLFSLYTPILTLSHVPLVSAFTCNLQLQSPDFRNQVSEDWDVDYSRENESGTKSSAFIFMCFLPLHFLDSALLKPHGSHFTKQTHCATDRR